MSAETSHSEPSIKDRPLLWRPDDASRTQSNIGRLMQQLRCHDYDGLHALSRQRPEDFWAAVLRDLAVPFATPPRRMLDLEHGVEKPHWLPGAVFNIADSCLAGPPSEPAIYWGSSQGKIELIRRGALREQAVRVASALRRLGYESGDRLAIVMPMTPECVAVYLGILFAGCVAVSIADSFAAKEIARRLKIAQCRGVFCTFRHYRGGKEIHLYDRVVMADGPPAIVVDPAPPPLARSTDLPWSSFIEPTGGAGIEPRLQASGAEIHILFSSGTTGDPKAIVWDQVTPIKCASDGRYHQDIRAGDVVAWPTNLGWMMGPWLIFASLLNRAAIALFEDITHAAAFGKFLSDVRATMLGVVPSLVRQWKNTRCMEPFDWSTIRTFSSTGEASQPEEMAYLSTLAGGKPIIEYCGGTEIGGGYITSSLWHENRASAFSCPALGNAVLILDDAGRPSNSGELFLVPPSLGSSSRLLNRSHHDAYFAGCPRGPNGEFLRRHGDHFEKLASGFFIAGGRVDDTMNLGGIKVSSAEIEAVINELAEVKESAAIAFNTSGGPEQLALFLVPWSLSASAAAKPASDTTSVPDVTPAGDDWQGLVNQTLKAQLNTLFRASRVYLCDRLPRTASQKVLRRELRRHVEGALREAPSKTE